MKVDAPIRVKVPAAGADQPSWVRVGLIAAVGFAIGVGWPRLVGAKLGPSLPAEPAASVMTPVKVPTVPCADAAPGQETAATNATAAKVGFDMLNLPRSLGDRPATESADANDRVP